MSAMGDGGDDQPTSLMPDGHVTRGDRARSEPNESAHRPEHAKGSNRMPTIPDDELDDENRKTEKMSAAHFRALLNLPAPAPLSSINEHEDVASSNLMAEALAQIKAGAQLRMTSESDVDDGDDVISRLRPAPATLPISTQRLAEIKATADVRQAVEMAPLVRPAPRPMERMPVIPRGKTQLVQRLDGWMLGSVCVLIVAVFATVALLLSR